MTDETTPRPFQLTWRLFIIMVGTATVTATAATGVMMLIGVEPKPAIVAGITGAVVASTAVSQSQRERC